MKIPSLISLHTLFHLFVLYHTLFKGFSYRGEQKLRTVYGLLSNQKQNWISQYHQLLRLRYIPNSSPITRELEVTFLLRSFRIITWRIISLSKWFYKPFERGTTRSFGDLRSRCSLTTYPSPGMILQV